MFSIARTTLYSVKINVSYFSLPDTIFGLNVLKPTMFADDVVNIFQCTFATAIEDAPLNVKSALNGTRDISL